MQKTKRKQKRGTPRRRGLRRILLTLLLLALAAGVLTGVVNAVMLTRGSGRIAATAEDGCLKGEWDCILVLGAGVRDDGTPSHMLSDRLETAVLLYEAGVAPKLLMSGDHGREDYDEVNVMRQYALDRGVPSEDIFMDHAGFSTYDSLYRARDVFCCRRVLIVTQRYHLYRALYVADALGLEAAGMEADLRSYAGQPMREAREVAARLKDFVYTLVQVKPAYLGEKIPVSGNGEATLG